MAEAHVREHWGTQFHVVPEGLAEDEVVSFVDELMEKGRKEEKHASLVKLAEQTVVEADRLAESIKKQARKEAEDERAGAIAAAKEQAREETQRLVKRAERDAVVQAEATLARTQSEAQDIIAKAQKEAQDITESAREKVTAIESQAHVEAEYIVRRFTVRFAEELRSVVVDTSNNMIPNLNRLMKESGHGSGLSDGDDAKAAISPGASKGKSSSRR